MGRKNKGDVINMKALVVYYSRTGTTKKVAEKIAKELSADIEEIVDLKRRNGPIGFLSGGKDAATKKLTEIKTLEKDPEEYDLVVIGSPVWAGTMAPAIRTYISVKKLKKTAFFATRGGADARRIFADMLEIAVDTELIGRLDLSTKEVKVMSIDEKIGNFVKEIREKTK
jgi:flavodoxin